MDKGEVMGNFKSWSYFLRLIFIVGLFTLFLLKFALPSINNYLDAGVIIEKSSARREDKDSPAITFCALNNMQIGWKNQTNGAEVYQLKSNWKTVEEAVACFNDGTFYIAETIGDVQDELSNSIKTDNDLWIEDVTGGIFKGVF